MTAWGYLGGLLRACHPEPTVAVTTVAAAFAVAAGRGAGAGWVAAAVLAGQLSVGWCNDYVDHDRDLDAGRRDKPIVTGDVPAVVVGVSAVLALAAAVVLSLPSGMPATLAHVVGLAAAWGYNLGLKATALSPAPYAIGFGGLPAFVVLGLPGNPWPPAWLVLAGALLGMGAHFANVLPDLADDVRHGVVGLPHRLGARASALTSAGLLLAASVALSFGPGSTPDALGVVSLAVVVMLTGVIVLTAGTAERSSSRLPFRLAMAVAVIDTAVLIARGGEVLA